MWRTSKKRFMELEIFYTYEKTYIQSKLCLNFSFLRDPIRMYCDYDLLVTEKREMT